MLGISSENVFFVELVKKNLVILKLLNELLYNSSLAKSPNVFWPGLGDLKLVPEEGGKCTRLAHVTGMRRRQIGMFTGAAMTARMK